MTAPHQPDSHARTGGTATVDVQLGTHTVPVPRGGLFDRFHMDTDLDVVARDPRVPGVEFFRHLPKVQVASPIGQTYTPNFYYAMSSAQLIMVAPTSALRRRLPDPLDPLEIAPGFGLASIMLFRYDVCDIDFYTEAAVGIAVKPARHGGFGAIDLAAALKNDALDAYVLSLPVSTEIAQVRGHDGYGFPKWVTRLDVDIDDRTTRGRIANDSGGLDLALTARTPAQRRHRTGVKVSSMTSYTQLDDAWHSTYSQTNALASGSTLLPRDVQVELGDGRLADDVRSLRPVRNLRLDVMTLGQLALHMPAPISVE